MYVDLHVLQTVPPSNLNRDDTGSPKTAYYGGVRRARVSSQAWKRATRQAFKEVLDTSELGVRTKRVVDLLAKRILAQSPDITEKDARERAIAVFKAIGISVVKPRTRKPKEGEAEANDESERSEYLIFLSNSQLDRLAAVAIEAASAGSPIEKTAARKAADTNHSIDVALFGRMVADAADLNVDAAAQVAHAISVHAVDNEFDYFTAVDDENPEEESGAGMIGTVEYNSSTLYRYATVNIDSLTKNLGDAKATGRAIEAFIRSFVTSMPTGKQNTFANRTLPDAVVAMVRHDQPVNLVGAFEDPVRASDSTSRIARACERLAEQSEGVDAAFGPGPSATYVVRVGDRTSALDALAAQVDFDSMVRDVGSLVRRRLGAEQ
jgi:CRISPR system Cascade subunit CasC